MRTLNDFTNEILYYYLFPFLSNWVFFFRLHSGCFVNSNSTHRIMQSAHSFIHYFNSIRIENDASCYCGWGMDEVIPLKMLESAYKCVWIQVERIYENRVLNTSPKKKVLLITMSISIWSCVSNNRNQHLYHEINYIRRLFAQFDLKCLHISMKPTTKYTQNEIVYELQSKIIGYTIEIISVPTNDFMSRILLHKKTTNNLNVEKLIEMKNCE